MNKALFHRINSIVLITALVFGQIGAGFLHNKHDAHEAVIDLDQTVLVNHGEHCKVCAIDWVHQFVVEENVVLVSKTYSVCSFSEGFASDAKPVFFLSKDRAPPVVA